MTESLLASNIVLWIVVVLLCGVVAALARQVGVLHERVAPAGALATAAGPQVGDTAPRMTIAVWAGDPIEIGGPGPARTLLFFVSPTCPVCKTLLPTAARVARSEVPAVRLVLASDGIRDEHEAFVREHDLARHDYVLSTELGLAYQVAKLPYAVLIDEQGVVRAKGLVNTREHLESLFEAERRGVASIQEYLSEGA